MSPLTIGQEVLDREIGQRSDFVPPPGIYRGRLEEVHQSGFPDWASNPSNNGFDSPDGEQISPQFGQVEPLDVGEEVDFGNRKLFVPNDRESLVVRDGTHNIFNIDPSDGDVPYWRLRRSVSYIAQLANAVGAAENGAGGLSVPDDFVEMLTNGVFAGSEVLLKVSHVGTYKDRNGDKKTDWKVTKIDPA